MPRPGDRELLVPKLHPTLDLVIPIDDVLTKASLNCEQILKDANVGTDNDSLLDFFRKRTPTSEGQERMQKLVRMLGSPVYMERVRASAELVELGEMAKRCLREASWDHDPEVARRAQDCLANIAQKSNHAGVVGAAASLLARRNVPEAAKALLGYLPFADNAENSTVGEEVQSALSKLAVRSGKPDKDVVAALEDNNPIRRAAAAEALCTADSAGQAPVVRKLLKDQDLKVRFRAALALARAKEKAAVAVLIDLLDKLPEAQAWQAEDFLLRIGGESSPVVALGMNADARRRCREAWGSWWQGNAAKTDLGQIEVGGKMLGYTLLVMLKAGQIIELDAHDKPRFKIEGLKYPLDAQMLPGDRVLVAEYQAGMITERNSKGEILWKKEVVGPLVGQRLRNGNTFIAGERELLEVDRQGKELYHLVRQDMIKKAARLPNGQIAIVTSTHQFIRLDPSGQEHIRFPVILGTSGGRLEMLQGGRVLIPDRQRNRLLEYDMDGKVVWEKPFPEPVAAVRLPNGNTLITSYRNETEIIPPTEIDREGNKVWEYKTDQWVTRAFRR